MMQGYAAGKTQNGLTAERFSHLLEWLSPDQENAGQKYEQIRRGLIKIFACRGCAVPEELADETINRVALKLSDIAADYVGEPARYFYAVADKIYLEYRRKMPALMVPLQEDFPARNSTAEESERKLQCLEECMEQLPARNRELILVYYGHENGGKEKINQRKKLAEQMSIPANQLWLRAHRIREILKKCVRECFRQHIGE